MLGFIASTGDRDLLTVETSRGAEQTISTAKYEVTGRGGKGRELLQRGQFTRVDQADAGGAAAAVRVARVRREPVRRSEAVRRGQAGPAPPGRRAAVRLDRGTA